MMNCWGNQPKKRPSFSDIVSTVAKYTEVIAGDLDINFNPFTLTHDLTSSKNKSKSLKGSPRVSLKASPRRPRASPLLTELKDQDTPSTSGEIHIQCPSEDSCIASEDLSVK